MAKIVLGKDLEKTVGGLQIKNLRDSNFDKHYVILGDEDEIDDFKDFAKKNNWRTQVGVYPGVNGQCVLYEGDDKEDVLKKLRAFRGFN